MDKSSANTTLSGDLEDGQRFPDPDGSSTPFNPTENASTSRTGTRAESFYPEQRPPLFPASTLVVRPTGLVVTELQYSGAQLRRAVQRAIDQHDTNEYQIQGVIEACQTEMPTLNPAIHKLVADAIVVTAQEVASLAQYSAAIRSAERTDRYRQTLEQIATLTRGPKVNTKQGESKDINEARSAITGNERPDEACARASGGTLPSPIPFRDSPVLACGPAPLLPMVKPQLQPGLAVTKQKSCSPRASMTLPHASSVLTRAISFRAELN